MFYAQNFNHFFHNQQAEVEYYIFDDNRGDLIGLSTNVIS